MTSISVCIITLGRDTLYKTLESIFSQKISIPYEIILILQGELDLDRVNRINKKNVAYSVHVYAHGQGFGFYRQKAVEYSSGDILAWIDDDEFSMNTDWLNILTLPIRNGQFSVVTSGCLIPLGQGYWKDCISLLGYPGGGALGFEKVWDVDSGITRHLCAGNFAIKREVILKIGFSIDANYGGEDNCLAYDLFSRSVLIKYEPKATVYHIARDLTQFYSWVKIRKKSFHFLIDNKSFETSYKRKLLRLVKNILKPDKYFFGKVYLLFVLIFG